MIARLGLVAFLAVLVAIAIVPFPSDRAAREGRLACDVATQTCTTHSTTAHEVRIATEERR